MTTSMKNAKLVMVQFVNNIREEVVETQESNSTGTDNEAMTLKEHSPVYSCIN